jgi:acyl carrier protein
MLEIVSKVMGFFATMPAQPAIGPDTALMENGILDSTGLVQLIMFLESTFGIEVADSDVVPETFATPNAIAAFVAAKAAP